MILAATLMVGEAYESSQAQTAQEIEAGISACLGSFYSHIKGGLELAVMAEGVLIIPSVVKRGIVVGGENGVGALRVGSKSVSYYKLASGPAGFQISAKAKDFVILFMTDGALKQFQGSKSWEVGVDGNVALANMGTGSRAGLIRMNDPVIGFVFDDSGFIADVSIQGAKFTKINP